MRVYLDNNSTTPSMVDLPSADISSVGSPSLVEDDVIGPAIQSIREFCSSFCFNTIFTSGATEGLSSVLRSFVGYSNWHLKRIVTCKTEHLGLLTAADFLAQKTGIEIVYLDVDSVGLVCTKDLAEVLRPGQKETLVALMAANNETGVLFPTREIGAICKQFGALFLCDITQAVGKMPVDLEAWNVDYATMSAHKIYGPRGVGALLVREKAPFEPLISGRQQGGLRGGTLNLSGIWAFGEACRLASECLESDSVRIRALRDHFEVSLRSHLANIWINGIETDRLCNTSNIGFSGVNARELIADLHDIACSTKSACSSSDPNPSHVLKAMGLSDEQAFSCVRFSLGRFTTEQEIEYALSKIVSSIRKLRRGYA